MLFSEIDVANAPQDEWVGRVLGVKRDRARALSAPQARIPIRQTSRQPEPKRYVSIHCTQLWDDAEDTIIAQVETLADALYDAEDATLEQIAARSVREISTRIRGELAPALREVDAMPAVENAPAVARARQLIGQYRQRIAGDRLMGLLDKNPYGVALTIRGTLTGALDRIDRELGI